MVYCHSEERGICPFNNRPAVPSKVGKTSTLNIFHSPFTTHYSPLTIAPHLTQQFIHKKIYLQMIRTICLLLLLCPYLAQSQKSKKIEGTVISIQDNQPILNAVIKSIPSNKSTIANSNGKFEISCAPNDTALFITAIGYENKFINLNENYFTIKLSPQYSQLDDAVVMAYGSTTKRLSTGNIGKISAATIAAQPVTNPLLALQGQITGVTVTPASGLPGASIKLEIRGRSSIAQGSEPFYIIDGVPFASGNSNLNTLPSALTAEPGTGMSPFATITPADIESIEILKDADATAIYGSRGANGVVLITTKKGKAGKTTFNASVTNSYATAKSNIKFLNTQQYINLRKEAFVNDGITPSNSNAPDLLLWDTTQYTNLQKILLGNQATTNQAQFSVAGGNAQTNFLLSGTYTKESTALPGSFNNQRGTLNMNINHSINKKLTIQAAVNYSTSKNEIANGDMGSFLSLAPSIPSLFDSTGKLNWAQNGVSFNNPMAFLFRLYTANTNNLNSRIQLGFTVNKNWQATLAAGLNTIRVDESSATPIVAQNPLTAPTGTFRMGFSKMQSWIVEPQLTGTYQLGKARLNILLGSTIQQNNNEAANIEARGYTSDDLLYSLAAAPTVSIKQNTLSVYKYAALFARLNYNIYNKYILNLSARRDGSSRFNTNEQFSNFGSVGAAWLISNESFIQKIKSISYAKLRGSFGITGNDQIGDYAYLDNWGSTQPYLGNPALYPLNLYNPNYQWETNRKLEFALEMGFLNDRLLFNATWFRNQCSNQLVNYRLPAQTGFYNIVQNLNALIENKGIELELSFKTKTINKLNWSVALNVTFPKNTLISFPGLATSSYATTYRIGHPLSVIYKYNSLGVNPQTGIYEFEDFNKDNAITTADYQVVGNTDPKWFGGINNTITHKNWQLLVFCDARSQMGRNYLFSLYNNASVPGFMNNLPTNILNRWQKPGDNATVQKLTAVASTATFRAGNNFYNSNGVYSDASFFRVRNIMLSYKLPVHIANKFKLNTVTCFMQAQNLFTMSNYIGDPEVQRIYSVPMPQTITVGINCNF